MDPNTLLSLLKHAIRIINQELKQLDDSKKRYHKQRQRLERYKELGYQSTEEIALKSNEAPEPITPIFVSPTDER